MKSISLPNNQELLVDDEDFEAVSKYRWRVYKGRHRSKGNYAATSIVKAWINDGSSRGYFVFLSKVIFKSQKHQTFTIQFRDKNNLNWQRANLIIHTNTHGNATLTTAMKLVIPWCPFGEAIIFPSENGRQGLCQQCSDEYQGPYWQCLKHTSHTFWPSWERKDACLLKEETVQDVEVE